MLDHSSCLIARFSRIRCLIHYRCWLLVPNSLTELTTHLQLHMHGDGVQIVSPRARAVLSTPTR